MTPADEPQEMGAVVRVHNEYGKYPETWVASNINGGNWYPDMETWQTRRDVREFVAAKGGHPDYWDVKSRGRVELLTKGDKSTYVEGWRAGCRAVQQAADELAGQCPGPRVEEPCAQCGEVGLPHNLHCPALRPDATTRKDSKNPSTNPSTKD